MTKHKWKVVPLCGDQMRDVREEDVLNGGHFRLCETYRGGGGYDRFPGIAKDRGLVPAPRYANRQFVVQLKGCNLDCPYCYVTRAGVWGDHVEYTTKELVDAYWKARKEHLVNVFHLMGGAPALQLKFWPELLDELGPDPVFHSDLLLTEGLYDRRVLEDVNRRNVLLAVNVKGMNAEEWRANTRKPWNKPLMWTNMGRLVQWLDPDRFYVTFTNVSKEGQEMFKGEYPSVYAYSIDLIEYDAVPYVDNMAWGGERIPATET